MVISVQQLTQFLRFHYSSENMTASCMRDASRNNYRNSSVIVDLAMGRYHVSQNVFLVYYNIMYHKNDTLDILCWQVQNCTKFNTVERRYVVGSLLQNPLYRLKVFF